MSPRHDRVDERTVRARRPFRPSVCFAGHGRPSVRSRGPVTGWKPRPSRSDVKNQNNIPPPAGQRNPRSSRLSGRPTKMRWSSSRAAGPGTRVSAAGGFRAGIESDRAGRTAAGHRVCLFQQPFPTSRSPALDSASRRLAAGITSGRLPSDLGGPANDRNRRNLVLAARSGEGLLIEPRAGARFSGGNSSSCPRASVGRKRLSAFRKWMPFTGHRNIANAAR